MSHENAAPHQRGGRCPSVNIVLTAGVVRSGVMGFLYICRPQIDLGRSGTLFFLGCCGMLVGAVIDVVQFGALMPTTLCIPQTGEGFARTLSLQVRAMPGMHIGMLLGSLIAIPVARRDDRLDRWRWLIGLLQNTLCLLGMLTGMALASFYSMSSRPSALVAWPASIGTMLAGMICGMVASAFICRVCAPRHSDEYLYD